MTHKGFSAPQQLPLPGIDVVRQAPKLNTLVRVFYKHPVREWPGAPARETVTTLTGALYAVVPAGEKPAEKLVDRLVFSSAARASKYDRWVLAARSVRGLAATRYLVVTMDPCHSWRLLSECEHLR